MEQRYQTEFGGAAVMDTAVGPVLEPFADVKRIAVLRGGGLGDLMFAVPAMEALAAAYPEASITLLGTPAHAALLEGFPGPVDRVQVLPFAHGVRPGPEDPPAQAAFFERMRGERFDLAVQLHGGGRFSNPFLLALDATHTVGTRTPDAQPLERSLPYIYYQNEVLRALEVVGLAGARPVTLQPRLAVTPEETERIRPLLQPERTSLVVIHPGASDPRRRWPAPSFAEVAAKAAQEGSQVLVVGDAGEADLAGSVVAQARAIADDGGRIGSVAGQLDLRGLLAVLQSANVMVANDSGPRHLAQAVGTPTVGIYWVGNMIMAGAPGRTFHRIHLGWVTHCPVCGVDVTQVGWNAERCDHDFPLTAAVSPGDVYADVQELTATSLLLRGR
ncbi:glycosyltransferase family 9 protein [Arthrobacter mobilis]|uniref:Glycosyltransferase family 9 protein n=1 Tax=Arthrobacter mobilis TaxID=2724944 RepID=A0A7X6HBP1_9MICC|nr:glycosyltransferase family 9 protein [Arthrobacter mobilis]NKX54132.1 glycosyltransferase family 9 protein [Arthrobacter mobilis]